MGLNFLVPILVFFIGGYFLIKLRFFFILRPISTARLMLSQLRDREGRRSLALALSGTLGIGNIFGVATAIIIGGVGSVFWLLISAVFASAIKYAEVSVSRESGGLINAIRNAFGIFGKPLSIIYALLAVLLACVMGTALQCGSFADYTATAYGIPRLFSIVIFLFMLTFIIRRSGTMIKKFTNFLIPLTTIIYIIMSLTVIFMNVSRIPSVISLIITDAFSLSSAVGGGVGYLFLRRISWGYCTGILSNEAGAGTSSLAHVSESHVPSDATGGIIEVVFDTVVLCTMSALAILLSVPEPESFDSGAELVLSAFYSSLGDGGIFLLMISVLLFALLTAACWYFYGMRCFLLLFGKGGKVFTAAFILSVVSGAFVSPTLLTVVSHTLLLFMSIITLSLLVKSSEAVRIPSELENINKDGFLKVFLRRRPKASRKAPSPSPRLSLRSRKQARRRSQ